MLEGTTETVAWTVRKKREEERKKTDFIAADDGGRIWEWGGEALVRAQLKIQNMQENCLRREKKRKNVRSRAWRSGGGGV